MKTAIIVLSATLSLSSIAVMVGCSSAPVEGSTTSKKDNTNDDSSASTKKTSSSSSSSSSSGGATTPAPTTPQTNDGGADDPAAEACFTQCIAGNAQAQQIDNTFMTCMKTCAENDEACFTKCDQQISQACQQAQAACQLLDQCDQKCFPDQQGQQQGQP